MCNTVLKRWLLASTLLVVVCALALPAIAANQAQEIAARALLGEAEKLIELALPQEAIPICNKVRTDYPGTEAALYADLRNAQSLMFLQQYDEALAVARPIVTANPGTIIACWAQCVVGQSLVRQGETSQGISELRKVQGMLPNSSDFGPIDEAREVLGLAFSQYLKDKTDDLDAAYLLGPNKDTSKDKAQVLAILAVYRAKQGEMEKAKTTVSRLITECASESAEVSWAKAEVAMCALDDATTTDPTDAVNTLKSIISSSASGDHQAARVAMELAKYYRTHKDNTNAVEVLEQARSKSSATASIQRILLQLGNLYYTVNRPEEARETLNSISEGKPSSGYVATALFCIGESDPDPLAARAALSKLAEGGYDTNWRAMAYQRLGDTYLYKLHDKVKAKAAYARALDIVHTLISEQTADLKSNWRELLQAQKEILQSSISSIDSSSEEVLQ